MKLEELMIGDWVEYEDIPCRVVDIVSTKKTVFPVTLDDGSLVKHDELDKLKPIELTDEILKNNDFEEAEDNMVNDRQELEVTVAYGKWELPYALAMCCAESAPIKYVHQLQNIWKTMGLERDIKL